MGAMQASQIRVRIRSKAEKHEAQWTVFLAIPTLYTRDGLQPRINLVKLETRKRQHFEFKNGISLLESYFIISNKFL